MVCIINHFLQCTLIHKFLFVLNGNQSCIDRRMFLVLTFCGVFCWGSACGRKHAMKMFAE